MPTDGCAPQDKPRAMAETVLQRGGDSVAEAVEDDGTMRKIADQQSDADQNNERKSGHRGAAYFRDTGHAPTFRTAQPYCIAIPRGVFAS